VGKKGVVRDAGDQAGAIVQVLDAAHTQGWQYWGLTWSPLVGPAGNIEYLLWLGMDGLAQPLELEQVTRLTKMAQAELLQRSL